MASSVIIGALGESEVKKVGEMDVKTVVFTALVGAVAILAAVAAWNYVKATTATTPAP